MRRVFISALAAAGLFAACDLVVPSISAALGQRCLNLPAYDTALLRLTHLKGARSENPTKLAFGPDGRLYVAERHGLIRAFSYERVGGTWRVVDEERIDLVALIPNHDDDGRPNPKIRTRLVAGLHAAGDPERPVLWVASSDPRIGQPDADTNSGVISRLERTAKGWRRQDVVRGLPRSKYDHGPSEIWVDPEGQRLLISTGGHTNAGAPSAAFGLVPEYALSAALLEIDLTLLPVLPYDLETLDDEDRPGERDAGDPFGGNAGKNQALLPADGPLRLWATGFRNAFDFEPTPHGVYVLDNGPNPTYGGRPVVDADGRVTNRVAEGGDHLPGCLHLAQAGYYGGHPNPTRADRANVFNPSQPQSPVALARPAEGLFLEAGTAAGALELYPRSANGLAQCRGAGWSAGPDAALLAVDFGGRLWRYGLNPVDGSIVERDELLQAADRMLLDVEGRCEAADPAVWMIDHGTGEILILEPRRADLSGDARSEFLKQRASLAACSTLKSLKDAYLVAKAAAFSWFEPEELREE